MLLLQTPDQPSTLDAERTAPRVVVADHHDGLRSRLVLALELHGFEVVAQAADGLTAIDLVDVADPDLLICDAALPLGDGVELAAWVRVAFPRTAVVLIGHDTPPQVVDAAARAGAAGVVDREAGYAVLCDRLRRLARDPSPCAPPRPSLLRTTSGR